MQRSLLAVAALLLLSGNMPVTEAASKFGVREGVESISLSPDGSKIAVVLPVQGQGSELAVAKLSDNALRRVIVADGVNERLGSCDFVSNYRLVCTVYTVADYNGDLVVVSRVLAISDDGTATKLLSNRDSGNQHYAQLYGGAVVDWLPGQDNMILMERNYIPATKVGSHIGNKLEGMGVDSIDTVTLKSRTVEAPDSDAVDFVSDGQGNIRIKGEREIVGATRQDSGVTRYYYRTKDSNAWKRFSEYDSTTREGLYPVAVDPVLDLAYAYSRQDGQRVLYRVSLDGTLAKEVAVQQAGIDVGSLIKIGRRKRVVGATIDGDYSYGVYFDKEMEALRESLSKALPGLPLVNIIDASDDESKLLIFAGSDQDPGRYYVLDRNSGVLNETLLVRPELENVAMAQVKPISYPAADGTMIPGYLTLPPGSDGKNLPALVLPHGGPEARDYWGFDWLVQYFANRGYAVLQPNFRGSAGYGDDWFQKNGFQSWRTAIADVDDAGRWLVSQGIADPAKMGIFGWSYGGYAALQSGVTDPGLFKAIIAVAPVTDLQMLKGQSRGWSDYALTRDYIGSGPHISAGSPARHAEDISVPVLLFHGTKDVNVDIDQSRLMEAKLKDADKPVQLVEYPDLDHYLDDSSARKDMLTRSANFLMTELSK